MRKLTARRAVVIVVAVVALLITGCSKGAGDSAQSSPSPSSTVQNDLANRTYATTAEVLDAVKAAATITAVPPNLTPPLGESGKKVEGPKPYFDIKHFDDGGTKAIPFGDWAYGDPSGSKLMVVYGDSRANMWALALQGVAAKNGYQLRVFGLPGCPAPDLQYQSMQTKAPNTNCDVFHEKAIAAIKTLKPDVIFATSVSNQFLADGTYPTRDQWQQGWQTTLSKLGETGAKLAMFADLPSWKNSFDRCVAAHTNDVQACSSAPADSVPSVLTGSEKGAADASKTLYIPTNQWICADRCEPIIANTLVFHDQFHLTKEYAQYITGAVGDAVKSVLS
jgi:hypothetical protein